MSSAASVQRPARREIPSVVRFFQVADSLGVLILLLVVVTVASTIAPGFFSTTNL